MLADTIGIRNFGESCVTLPLTVEFGTMFESVLVLRGVAPGKRGRMHQPKWDGTALGFEYEGADKVLRALVVHFSLPPVIAPCTARRTVAHFELVLEPQESREITVSCRIEERPVSSRAPCNAATVRVPNNDARAALLDGYARIETSSRALREVITRSLTDLARLKVTRGEHSFTAAGVPWYISLFGRDSLLPSLQCLAFNPDLAAKTAKALAQWQGTVNDARTHEEPGKILHELRQGELAHLHEVSQTPSYASVDSTLLFLIAIARHVEWTGDLPLFESLRPNIDRALAWLDRKAAENEAGYITYEGQTQAGQPVNQGWRDSAKGVLRADGSFPVPPLALVEVQGYAFQARRLIARLLRRVGEGARADQLERAARDLQSRLLHDFWMDSEGCYCLALERGGQQVTSVTSNTAQVLWTGIATPEHAALIASRVMRPDMFSGWGIRTVSADHVRFNPLAYQQGSVWPFDNALIVSGMRRYGQDEAASRIMAATINAARGFRRDRLPEFMAGTQRLPGEEPMHTPRADPLQAWSAGAIPFILTEMLGLRADGFGRLLHIRRPMLPDEVDELAIHDLSAAGGTASLRFFRHAGEVRVEPIKREGIEIVIE